MSNIKSIYRGNNYLKKKSLEQYTFSEGSTIHNWNYEDICFQISK